MLAYDNAEKHPSPPNWKSLELLAAQMVSLRRIIPGVPPEAGGGNPILQANQIRGCAGNVHKTSGGISAHGRMIQLALGRADS